MKELLFEDIPDKYKISYHGIHNWCVYVCPECHKDLLDDMMEHVKGFEQIGKIILIVIECKFCGIIFNFHCDYSTYSSFISTMERLEEK